MNDQQQAKRDLLRILKQWKADVNSEAPPAIVTWSGLCGYAARRATPGDGTRKALRSRLAAYNSASAQPTAAPFNANFDRYQKESSRRGCHRNRKRRAWVNKTIKELEQELTAVSEEE